MGEVLTGEGMQASKKKWKPLLMPRDPKIDQKTLMRNFLGSAQFCAKFILGFSAISSSWWDLTCNGKPWK